MSGQNARVYWEMFDGVYPTAQPDLYARSLDLDVDVGGYYAFDYPYYLLRIYGRATLDGPDLDTLYSGDIVAPSTSDYWTPRRIRVSVYAPEANMVRCIVGKVERKEGTFADPTATPPTKQYHDQYGTSDPPPWGIRIHAASVYCSSLGRNTRPNLILADILDNAGFTYSGPSVTWLVDQMAFVDIPCDRQDALDNVNGMLGWNYACWDGTEVAFALPKSGTAHVIAASDPRTTWSVEESLDETYNAVRVCYGSKRGKLREVIVHGSTAALRGTVRADTLQAPESIKSEKAATRFAKRYLASHETKQVAGSVSIQGKAPDVPGFSATGGTVSYDGAYTVHKFTTPGTVNLVCPGSIDAEVLVQGGGGGGSAGGGGAGGYRTGAETLTGSMAVTVGAGGPGAPYNADATSGSSSSFGTRTAAGGGKGGHNWQGGADGGSGGGGGEAGGVAGGSASPAGQGNAGGAGGATAAPYPAGGGGGAGAVGQTPPDGTHGGHGGAGLTWHGSDYAGGGGGGCMVTGGAPGTATHGGGAGNDNSGNGASGTAHTGGGGGGCGYNASPVRIGGNGGSGIVVVRYLTPPDIVGLDPLLIRPGDTVKMTGPARSLSGTHEITRVTLRPLEWTADVEFGTNSKRFDTWLSRLAAGAKSIKRR